MTASFQEATTQIDSLTHQLSELQRLNSKLQDELAFSAALNQKLRHFVSEISRTVTSDTTLQTDVLSNTSVPIAEIDADLFDKSLTELLASIICSIDRQTELVLQLEQKRVEYANEHTEFELFRQKANEQLQQLNEDHVNACRQIEDALTKDKSLLESKLQSFEELLLTKENDLVSIQSKKELLTKEFEEQLSVQKAQIEKVVDEKWTVKVDDLNDKLKRIDEEHCKTIAELKRSYEKTVEEAKTLQEAAERDKQQTELHIVELNSKLDAVEQKLRCAHDIAESLEQEKQTHDETMKQLKEDYEKIIDELNKRLSAQTCDVEGEMNLRLDDYLPMQRHEAVVAALKDQLKSVSNVISLKCSTYQHRASIMCLLNGCCISQRITQEHLPVQPFQLRWLSKMPEQGHMYNSY